MKTDDIRQAYLDFFVERDHRLVPSASLIPHDDPTLMFTSAGMVPFKSYYSGEVDPLPFTRATSCQKCFRAGGKASDLENVGKTLRHHTFFEMLGNFSFGDYFKREACTWALEFTRDVLKFDMDRVWVTYHEGDPETRDIWAKELGFPEARIVPLGDKDNWWGPAGDTGACGPCSEMHYDRGPEFGTGPEDKIGGDSDRFLEYWNMVFPQFDHQLDGSRPTLKNRGIDTGMGLARVAAILQNADSAYTIDAFWPITKAAAEMCGVDYENAPNDQRMAVNVVADHIRSLTFVISEGQVIGNTDRGYVLKRILRRAARYARQLGKTEPFIHSLVPVVVDTMGTIYPELKEKPGFVAKIIETDEEQFHRTMDRGMAMIEEELELLKKSGDKVFPGELAFHLWQQEGIPHEDVLEIAEDHGLGFDHAGYKDAQKKHKATSKGAGSGGGDDRGDLWRDILEKNGVTKFTGYDAMESAANVVAIVSKSGLVDSANDPEASYDVVLDETPFYAESGGQVGDRGMIITPSGQFRVTDTKKTQGGLYRHVGKLAEGTIAVGEVAKPKVNAMLRGATEANHSATHLMQGAMKRVLGSHVTQRGSLVNESGLRFDFTHLESLTHDQIREIEELVNEQIRSNGEVKIEVLPADEAAKVPGVIAPFDERYGEKIRVVSMGRPVAGDDDALRYWDVEYCGGTHVRRTGEIGMFAIRAESSTAQGIRRVEALTGPGAESYLLMARDAYRDLQQMLSVDGARVKDTVEKLVAQRRSLENEVAELKKQLAAGDTQTILANGRDVGGGLKLYTHQFDGATQDEMRHVALEVVRDAGQDSVVVFGSANDGKAALVVLVGDGGKGKVHAGNSVRELAKLVGGGGGGKPDFAQAGGKQPEKLPEALDAAAGIISAAIGA